MNQRFPDYENSGLNVISSIMKYFGAQNRHFTHPDLDGLLARGRYRNVVLFLLDGMGMEILARHLPADSFFNTHVFCELSAVYPSTTTAATTSIETDYAPGEHGWLGWSLYFREIDRMVDVFTNRVSGEKTEAADYPVGDTYMPLHPVFDRINRAGQAKAACISPYAQPAYPTLPDIHDALVKSCIEPGRHFLYAYWGEPDHSMHEFGVGSEEVSRVLAELEQYIQKLSLDLPEDTLLLVTADHGLINARHLYVTDHPALAETLIRPTSVEPRTTVFYVKPECKEAFPKLFREAFPEGFLLMTAEEFRLSGILGPGEYHPKVADLTGDYVALAMSDACIEYRRREPSLVGMHAGMTAAEMRVPLIAAGK